MDVDGSVTVDFGAQLERMRARATTRIKMVSSAFLLVFILLSWGGNIYTVNIIYDWDLFNTLFPSIGLFLSTPERPDGNGIKLIKFRKRLG